MKITLNGGLKEINILFRHFLVRMKETSPFTLAIIEWKTAISEGRAEGRAFVHPNDRFIKRVGRRLALTRAMKLAPLTREERRAIWKGVQDKGMKVG